MRGHICVCGTRSVTPRRVRTRMRKYRVNAAVERVLPQEAWGLRGRGTGKRGPDADDNCSPRGREVLSPEDTERREATFSLISRRTRQDWTWIARHFAQIGEIRPASPPCSASTATCTPLRVDPDELDERDEDVGRSHNRASQALRAKKQLPHLDDRKSVTNDNAFCAVRWRARHQRVARRTSCYLHPRLAVFRDSSLSARPQPRVYPRAPRPTPPHLGASTSRTIRVQPRVSAPPVHPVSKRPTRLASPHPRTPCTGMMGNGVRRYPYTHTHLSPPCGSIVAIPPYPHVWRPYKILRTPSPAHAAALRMYAVQTRSRMQFGCESRPESRTYDVRVRACVEALCGLQYGMK
ncbi:hypothetical protein C8R44DRAFT_733389 [Mycena epipterygia]|nr:hypothetical protein C8R44DRAFT_733389 [Mycena epipterygia]